MNHWVRALALLSWWVLSAAGCAEPNAVDCGDGTVCPPGNTCVVGGGCISDAQRAACAALAEGEVCSVPGVGAGICRGGGCAVSVCGNGDIEADETCDDGNVQNGDGCSGTCRSDETCGNGVYELVEECDCGDADHPGPATCAGTVNGGSFCSETCVRRACGNGVKELDEACDDGNVTSGDGCSYDCTSLETCGNDKLDSAAGEECDDGNRRNRDGCSSDCRSELLDWRLLNASSPSARNFVAMAYDVARGRTVMFGGAESGGFNDFATWEHDGVAWREVTRIGPPPRYSHAMAYDAARHRVVMFGGSSNGPSALRDTWEFDGVRWELKHPAVSPPARQGTSMTFDAVRGKIVLYGGNNTGVAMPYSDTWLYDGTNWAPLTTNTSPPRVGHRLVYDPVRNLVVLFGGTDGGFATSETWELSGATWTNHVTSTTPPARFNHGLAYDVRRGKIVMYAGNGNSGALDDTWEFGPTDWALKSPTALPTPAARSDFGFVYDAARARSMGFGGFSTPNHLADVWQYDGIQWSAPALTTPLPRHSHAMAYDVARARLVLFGGTSYDYATVYDDTWEFDGEHWKEIITSTKPPARRGHVMAYDSVRKRVIMVTGSVPASGQPYQDLPLTDQTWEFDGSNWAMRTASHPPDRGFGAMAFDTARGRLVLFGGSPGLDTLQDTWELDSGNTWTPVTTATSPPKRQYTAMVYDETRHRIVMFGGFGTGWDFATWEYDGTNWSAIVDGPSTRDRHALAYDTARRRMVMYGGGVRDTWDYDGAGWQQHQTDNVPPTLSSPAMAFDVARQQVVLFGGNTALNTSNETWVLSYRPRATGESCSAGIDYDGDTAVGCADDECWSVCTPACVPDPPTPLTCPATPTCGDGTCSNVENCRNCPADCAKATAACPTDCGDYFCDPGENVSNCPGDC